MGFPPQPTVMGYDRSTAMFSPDGRLFQVEYAFEAVRRGWTAIGVRVKEGVVLVAEKRRTAPLADMEQMEKIMKIDEHIGASSVGLGGDGRILIDYARLVAIRHRLLYGERISVEYLTRQVCDVMQSYTQFGGVRPFGVAIILGGVDDRGPALFVAEPSGQYFGYKAVALGSGSGQAYDVLEKEYNEDMSLEDAIKLALKALLRSTEQKPTADLIEIGVIDVKTAQFRKLSKDERAKLLEQIQ
ncbi:proteasome endopeptidase complex, alpha subunit [Pyrolobus fumarii 1A]|uniref:Proteasome subunit alpha n=2 Tax=Pyrolobus fumarii TaxID=54252 RepID=G0ECM6_PYRF1|nr:archaeal proteasome endopeptidase complex subunit alpha [Pyrolobus fumarii]AEM39596.1 proteasome endopeptidase complex, alpha subunit [Pyrolobus fumarii 1A]